MQEPKPFDGKYVRGDTPRARGVRPIDPAVLHDIYDADEEALRSSNGCFDCDTFGQRCERCRNAEPEQLLPWPVAIGLMLVIWALGAYALATV